VCNHLWRPDEIGITKASELIIPLAHGLHRLVTDKARFVAMNPENGWGSYDSLVAFIREYILACLEYPDATVSVSR
jgi:hypothetical protein